MEGHDLAWRDADGAPVWLGASFVSDVLNPELAVALVVVILVVWRIMHSKNSQNR